MIGSPRSLTAPAWLGILGLAITGGIVLSLYACGIPIDRAMQMIVQQGLPKPPTANQPATLMAGETQPTVQRPLTDGFARTGYELETIEAREQKNEFNRAEAHHE